MANRSNLVGLCSLTSVAEAMLLTFRSTACREIRNPVAPAVIEFADDCFRSLLALTSGAGCHSVSVLCTGRINSLGSAIRIMSERVHYLRLAGITSVTDAVLLPGLRTVRSLIGHPVAPTVTEFADDRFRSLLALTPGTGCHSVSVLCTGRVYFLGSAV